MSDHDSAYQGKDLVQVLVNRAMTDDAFRKEFLSNPEAVVEKETGQKLPSGLHIKAIEDTPDTVHIVVPAKIPAREELSDTDLENVVGGVMRAAPVIRSGPSPFRIISGPGLVADWGIGGVGAMPGPGNIIRPT